MSGKTKGEVSSWWLDHIENCVDQHLEEKGFRKDALPDNYTSQPPNEMGVVRKNASIVQACMLATNSSTHDLVDTVTKEVYQVVDDFVENVRVALCIGTYSSDELQVKSLQEDLRYLERMKQMDDKIRSCREKGEVAPTAIEMSDIVPIAGLVMARFHMMDCELRTVQEMWGLARKEPLREGKDDARDSSDDDTATYSTMSTRTEARIDWRMACRNIGGRNPLPEFNAYFRAASADSAEAREGLAKKLGIGAGAMGFLHEAHGEVESEDDSGEEEFSSEGEEKCLETEMGKYDRRGKKTSRVSSSGSITHKLSVIRHADSPSSKLRLASPPTPEDVAEVGPHAKTFRGLSRAARDRKQPEAPTVSLDGKKNNKESDLKLRIPGLTGPLQLSVDRVEKKKKKSAEEKKRCGSVDAGTRRKANTTDKSKSDKTLQQEKLDLISIQDFIVGKPTSPPSSTSSPASMPSTMRESLERRSI